MLIPQGMAYALIAGLPPVYGLYASIIPQLVYAIFGTSRQLSVAPVAMDSLLVAAGVSVLATEGTDTYIAFAILLAFFMGLFQLLLGVLKMGFITNLLSKPVISGFTSAAALIIGLNQLKYLLGTEIEKSNHVITILINAFEKIDQTHLLTLIIGLVGIGIIRLSKSIHNMIPGALIAVIFGILSVYFFNLEESGVAIVKSIPEGLPAFILPNFELGQFGKVVPLALTISVVAFMEAYSVAKAVESQRKDHKVNANQELIGLGAANLIGSLFQSFPVTGGFSRTAVNNLTGANTPLSSIISAGLIALTLLFLTPLFYFLPKAILASVIIVAITSLIDLNYAKKLWNESRIEFGLLIMTFLVTLNFSMVTGIVTGVLLSILLLLFKAAYPHIARLGRLTHNTEFRNINRYKNTDQWPNILIIRIDAPLSFINIQTVRDYLEETLDQEPEIDHILIDARPISHMDASAVQVLSDFLDSLNERNIRLILAEVVGPVRDVLFRTRLIEKLGRENLHLNLNDALEFVLKEVDPLNREALQHNEKSKARIFKKVRKKTA